MGTRIHLYALPGLPLHLEDLMPQPLLARCAGSLSAQGHSVLVVDEGSVECLEPVCPPELRDLLRDAALPLPRRHEVWPARFSARQRRIVRALEQLRARRVGRVIDALETQPAPSLVVIQIQRLKDVTEARHLARALRASVNGLYVVSAGDFVNQHARALLHGSPEFDAACLGPAESILTRLARCGSGVDELVDIPGLIFRDGCQLREGKGIPVAIDPWFAPADYHPARYPALLDGGKVKLFSLAHSTGLSHLGHYRGGYQPRALVVRESRQMRSDMEQLHRLYGAATFHITGAHTPAHAMQSFAVECMSLPFTVSYSRESHVHELGSEILPSLSNSGCQALALSLLSGSQWTLSDFYGENWTISQAEACLKRLRPHGIYVHTEFMFPCPADDYHTRSETVRMIRRNRPDSVHISVPVPAPGSAWYQHAAEFDFTLPLKKIGAWLSNPPRTLAQRDAMLELPFHINGKRGATVAAMFDEVMSELAELRVQPASCVTAGLMARVSGFEGNESEFVNALENAAACLDLARLREMIELFNMRATASIDTIDIFPPVSIRKAVGN